GLTIGILKEIMENENRVAGIPETVKKMVDNGAKVLVESGAGLGSFYTDADYKNAGAEIINDPERIYNSADAILKVKEPLMNEAKNKHEVDMMKSNQVLISFLHPSNPINHDMVKKLAQKGVISFSLDCIPRISRAQSMDALTSMSTVAGYKAIISAACRLPKFIPMITTAVGMFRPAIVFVVGTGVAGLQSLATAKRLGAEIYAADVRPDAVEQSKSLGAKIIDTGVPPEIAIGEGGYARHLSDEWIHKERQSFYEIVKKADIVVLSALVPRKIAPILVDETMVRSMKPGSVIVDIAIDQGGNCELTESGIICVKHNVTIDGTKNIPGSVALSASSMFAQNVLNFLSLIVKDGKININKSDEIIASALITENGKIVNPDVLEEIVSYKEHR
ncbi:MAG TPA: NAD(P) transhydrogenase subunit alpha, partial [Spirochaetota bacterium]|nr:NAD(P) transhydrogenase subunit alpha [Spirochaetota bacterium]